MKGCDGEVMNFLAVTEAGKFLPKTSGGARAGAATAGFKVV